MTRSSHPRVLPAGCLGALRASRQTPSGGRWQALLAAATTMLLAVGTPRAALAQVNAEVLRPNPLRAGWSGAVDASLAVSRGNIELLDVGGAARVQYQTLHPQEPPPEGSSTGLPFIAQRGFVVGSARYAERSDVTFVRQAFVHARWTAMWHERVGNDVFAQYQLNEFLRLRARMVVGAGVRVEIVHDPVLMTWAGSGYMLEYERIAVEPGASDPSETYAHRWTNYLTSRLALLDGQLLLQNTVYFQPRFDDFADFRVLDELEQLAKVSDAFALGTTVGVLYDSAPPTGVKTTDLRLMSTMRIWF